jgi:hypothetical protein
MSTLASVILRDVIANIPAAGIAGRLFCASDTAVLYRDNGVSWDVVAIGGGSVLSVFGRSGAVVAALGDYRSQAAVAVTGAIAPTTGEHLELATAGAADITRTLPTAVGIRNQVVIVKKVDSGVGNVIVEGNGSETIDNALTYTLSEQNEFIAMISDNANWQVIGGNL